MKANLYYYSTFLYLDKIRLLKISYNKFGRACLIMQLLLEKSFCDHGLFMIIYAGVNLNRSTIDYNILGSTPSKVFGIFNALGTIAFSFGDAMLPEIQVSFLF